MSANSLIWDDHLGGSWVELPIAISFLGKRWIGPDQIAGRNDLTQLQAQVAFDLALDACEELG